MTNWGKVVDFSTFHYIFEHFIKEVENKKMDQSLYLIFMAVIIGTD